MSSSVFPKPKLIRMDSFSIGVSSPYIASNTCEGSIFPAVQAEPVRNSDPIMGGGEMVDQASSVQANHLLRQLSEDSTHEGVYFR